MGFEDADGGLATVFRYIDLRQSVKPFGKALVDAEVLSALSGFNHIAKRLERLSGELLH